MQRAFLLCVLGGFGVSACYPLYSFGEGEGSSESGGEPMLGWSSSGATPTSGGSSGSSGGSTDTSGTSSSSSSGASSSEAMTFIIPSDYAAGAVECDPYGHDCPRGQKCAWYAANGGNSWDATKCVPVMEDAVGIGDACFVVENGVSGLDNCVDGAMCWDTDAENQGTCVALCGGTPEAVTCPPGTSPAGGRSLCLCLKSCDPLAQDCDMADDVCIGSPGGGFLCVLDASGEEGQVHDPCEYANACDPGLICLNSTAAVECDEASSGCCEPFCNHSDPDAVCPGQGQVCNPYYEEGTAPPGEEHIGYCALPA
jgi:hypothetical protein